jgi:hypothetical protein
MHRWVDPAWYRYLWHRIGPDGRLLVAVLAAAAVAVGGFFSVRAFASSDATVAGRDVRLTTTLTRVVHVRDHGRTVVVERIPVVHRMVAKPVTLELTTTVHGPTGTRVVTRPVVRYQSVTRSRTDTRLETVTNERTSTVVQHVTNERTVTVVETVTAVRTQTSPAETVLVRQAPATVTVTTTAPFMTITVPTFTLP